MYCKYCGQIIEDDSIFCKHCGKRIQEYNNSSLKTGVNLFSRFTTLSQKYQISALIYIVWLLGWICYLIANADQRYFAEDYLMPFFICTILVPFICLSGYYIYKLNKKKTAFQSIDSIDNEKTILNESSKALDIPAEEPAPSGIESLTQNSRYSIVNSEMLLTFARQKGKMQIINKGSEESSQTEHYCLFTDGNGIITRVNFDSQTEKLTSKEISEKKFQLCVNLLESGDYELAYINNKEIEDALPF